MDQQTMQRIFLKVWCAETSAFPDEWTPENPAYGQCLSTARIVKRHLGGHVMWSYVVSDDSPHFYNLFDDGSTMDLTASQFPAHIRPTPLRVMDDEELDAFAGFFPAIGHRQRLLNALFATEMARLEFA